MTKKKIEMSILKKHLFFWIFFVPLSLFAQRFEGNIVDKETKDPLVGASVAISESKIGTYTDDKGTFKLSLRKGSYNVKFSYIGYKTQEITIDIPLENELTVELTADNRLAAAVVSARAKDENVTRPVMGVEKLQMVEIRRMPALMGEVDLIKAIQLLPGVQVTSEGSSGFSVRGGTPDQNLILLDNTTVYNASHLLGFFSVFNNDVISNIELYKGDLPIKFGGRISSLLEINTLNEMAPRFSGSGGLGLISSRLMLNGPMGEKTSWMVGGRRSYADLFLKLSSDEALNKSTMYFYDLNAKLTHRFSNKDRLDINMYYGKDKFGTDITGFDYGNTAASVTWGHVYNPDFSSKVSVNVSNYNYGLYSDFEGGEMSWKSNLFDLMLRLDFFQNINRHLRLNYGITSTYHDFTPGTVKSPNFDEYKLPKNYSLEHGVYLSNEQQISKKLTLRYGLRWAIFQNMGEATVYNFDKNYDVVDTVFHSSGKVFNTYHAMEPRIGAVFQLNKFSSLKANYAHNTQFLQLANNSASGSPLDIWFTASPNVKPQSADLYSIGYFRNFNDNMFETSLETYYKEMNNVIDFADHAQLIMNKELEGEIRIGKGKSYGMELMIRKNKGKLTGFVNYTLSRSERTIPEINNGETYLVPFDKTHVINVVASYDISKKWSVSANWVFATGNPVTYPVGRFEVGGDFFPIYSKRNEFRRPNYHRLDLSVNYVPNPDSKKRWKGEWNFSLYNAYGRKNPWIINFKQDGPGKPPYAEMTYLFSIVPSITYNFKF